MEPSESDYPGIASFSGTRMLWAITNKLTNVDLLRRNPDQPHSRMTSKLTNWHVGFNLTFVLRFLRLDPIARSQLAFISNRRIILTIIVTIGVTETMRFDL